MKSTSDLAIGTVELIKRMHDISPEEARAALSQHLEKNLSFRDAKRHSPKYGMSDSRGVGIKSKVFISIKFDQPLRYDEAVGRAQDVIRFCGLLVGRRQESKRYTIEVVEQKSAFPYLEVYETMRNTDRSSFGAENPMSIDTLIDGVLGAEEFSQTVTTWLARNQERREARNRFFYTFFRRQTVTPDRLINSANLFDSLPEAVFPARPDLTPDLATMVEKARGAFKELPVSYERNSILQALGRVKSPNLRFKILHRAKKLMELYPGYRDRWPKLVF